MEDVFGPSLGQVPCVGLGHPFPFTSSSFLLFPFSFSHSLYLFFFFFVHPFPFSTRAVSLRFQAGGLRRQPNPGFVCFVYYRASYANAILGVVILSVRPSIRLSICPSHVLCD